MKKVKSKKILPEDFMIRVNPHMCYFKLSRGRA